MANNFSEKLGKLSPLKRAALALRKKQSELDAAESARTEPIAIIGMGCRFPGAGNPDAYWRLLQDGVDAIREVPPERWDMDAWFDPDPEAPGKIYTRHGGFLSEIDRFDPQFFGISPREAIDLDPQQRLLLEVAWEAMENAGLAPDGLIDRAVGIFVGVSQTEYGSMMVWGGRPEDTSAHVLTGGLGISFTAGRLSYVLGLQGSALAVDTACSSSLVAIHAACQSLRGAECESALAGGVNLNLFPESMAALSRTRALSPEGRCKTFDAGADGYARSEGCGIVVLKRLSDAMAAEDNILAVIRGSAINHDGPSSGFTAPNGLAQEKVIREALQNARVTPAEVSYIEAHGTGTSLGDPIEVGALGAVFGEDHSSDAPLTVGSVKTNFGHLESAAGIAGLMKIVLSLQHEEIPPHLHFNEPNPHIDWARLPFRVPVERQPWPRGQEGDRGSRIAGVSSFGITGTNAHVVLEEAPSVGWGELANPNEGVSIPNSVGVRSSPQPTTVANDPPPIVDEERPCHLLTLSAQNEAALRDLARAYEAHLQSHPDLVFADTCFTANVGRSHFGHRLALVAGSATEAQERLRTADYSTGKASQGKPKLAFLFTGQGSEYPDMGWQLYETQPVFRATLARCDAILRPLLDTPLIDLLYAPSPNPNLPLLKEMGYLQPTLFALEYALAEMWKSWGITPDVVMGHSAGEYVAACVAGVFSLDDGLKFIANRGRLMQTRCERGAMLALSVGEEAALSIIAPFAQEVSVATINSPESVVVSGRTEAIGAIAASLADKEDIDTKLLPIPLAAHSAMVEPMLPEFEEIAQSITYAKPRIPLCSNVTGQIVTGEIATPAYWLKHLRQPVRFAAGVKTLHKEGFETFLEIGPKPALLGMARQCLSDDDAEAGILLPSLREGQEDWRQLLQSLGEWYVNGGVIDWTTFDKPPDDRPTRRKVPLPTYPFQRQRYWIDETSSKDAKRTLLPETSLFNLLRQGDTRQLAQQLQKAKRLSEQELEQLPGILEILAEQYQRETMADTIGDWLYEIQWQSRPRPSAVAPPAGSWLIFADGGGMGEALAYHLNESGNFCVPVYAGEEFVPPSFRHGLAEPSARDGNKQQGLAGESSREDKQKNNAWYIDPSDPSHFERLFTDAFQEETPPLQGIIHLWSLDATEPHELTTETLGQAQILGCGSVLHLLRTLSWVRTKQNRIAESSTKLWLVSRNAVGLERMQAQSPDSSRQDSSTRDSLAIAQAPLWGLGKVIALEHAELWGGMIDNPEVADVLVEIGAAIVSGEKEDQVAYRDGQRYVARLVKSDPLAFDGTSLSTENSYLITGGLGTLGLKVARWMIDQGVRYLVLTGRGVPSIEAQRRLDQLEEAGATIMVANADVSDGARMTRLFQEIEEKMPSLRGVIHAAGVLDKEILTKRDWGRFRRAIAAKVEGSWHLHTLTRAMPLDFFVCFSSTASLLGGLRLGSDAAAFMDTLAHLRHFMGLPGSSIDWTMWADDGMSLPPQEDGKFEDNDWGGSDKLAEYTMAPGIGLRILGTLMRKADTAADAVQVVVLPKDLSYLQGFYGDRIPPPLLSELYRSESVQPSGSSDFMEELEKIPVEKKRDHLATHIQSQLNRVLGFAPSQTMDLQKGFFDLGMDSLMAVEIKNRLQTSLGCKLPTTLAFKYSTPSLLIDYIATQILALESPEGIVTESKRAANEPEEILNKVKRLSEEDLEALIDEKVRF